MVQDDSEDWHHRSIETIRLSQNSLHEGSHTKEDQRAVKGFLANNWHLKWTCLSQVLIEFSGKILNRSPTKETVEPLLKDEHKARREKIRHLDEKKVPERKYNENRVFR